MDGRAICSRDRLSWDVLLVDRHWLGGLGARSWIFSLLLLLILILILILVLFFILIPVPVLILIFIIILVLILIFIFILISILVFIVIVFRVYTELCKLTRRVLIESARVILGKDHRNGCGRYGQVGHRRGMICHQRAEWAMITRGTLGLGDGVGWSWLGGGGEVWGRKGQVGHGGGTICHQRAERPNASRVAPRLRVDIGRGWLGCGRRRRRRGRSGNML